VIDVQGIKGNIAIRGQLKTTAGSRALLDSIVRDDSTIVIHVCDFAPSAIAISFLALNRI